MNKAKKSIKIVIISNYDLYGGSSIAAYNLHTTLLKNGYKSLMIVQNKISNNPTVIQKENRINTWISNLINNKWNFPYSYRVGIIARKLFAYFNDWYKSSLIEQYNLKQSNFYSILKFRPDIIHFNTGGGDNFFNLREIKTLSKFYKVVFSIHDLWIVTKDPPKISHNDSKKAATYKYHQINQSKINFISHSKWVHNIIKNTRRLQNNSFHFIQHSIDTAKFRPLCKSKVRKKLGLKKDSFILLTCAIGILSNPYKDFKTLLNAYLKIIKGIKRDIFLIVIGDRKENLLLKEYEDKFIFVSSYTSSTELAEYYSSADLYIHSSHIETWGLAISEALSCGIPAIASSVGAIPEQIRGYSRGIKNELLNLYQLNYANGFLFERKDSETLYALILWCLKNEKDLKILGKNARKFAKTHLDINKQIPKYIDYYRKLLSK